jgi:hypothetical protein
MAPFGTVGVHDMPDHLLSYSPTHHIHHRDDAAAAKLGLISRKWV